MFEFGSKLRGSIAAGLGALLLAHVAVADDVGDDNPLIVKPSPVFQQLEFLKATPPQNDAAPVWEFEDKTLQAKVDAALKRLGLGKAVQARRLGLALIDITDIRDPKLASVNGDQMMYAASLPKIAILLACFEEIAAGNMEYDDETQDLMKAMIRRSSNSASTTLMNRVGKEKIAEILTSPKYRLYDPLKGGGLWVGKDYGKRGLWLRDPIHNLSHGATAIEVARFYYMLETDKLVNKKYSKEMRKILGQTYLRHKFAKAVLEIDPYAQIMRKSGSWRTFHSDSAVIRHNGISYIAVALCNDPKGGEWLTQLAREFDAIIKEENS